MKKLLPLIIILCCVDLYGQIKRDRDYLDQAEKTAIGKAQQDAFEYATRKRDGIINRNEPIKWQQVKRVRGSISYTIYAEPKAGDPESFAIVFNMVIDKLLEKVVNTNLIAAADINPEFEVYFLNHHPGKFVRPLSLPASGVPTFDVSDFEKLGVMAFTRDALWTPKRRIVVQMFYNTSKKGDELQQQLFHAIGHIFHEKELGEASYWSSRSYFHNEPDGNTGSYIIQEYSSADVTSRATHSRKEFVAEVFATTCRGVPINHKYVWERYGYLWSPYLNH